jgi:hypothetical protein
MVANDAPRFKIHSNASRIASACLPLDRRANLRRERERLAFRIEEIETGCPCSFHRGYQ